MKPVRRIVHTLAKDQHASLVVKRTKNGKLRAVFEIRGPKESAIDGTGTKPA